MVKNRGQVGTTTHTHIYLIPSLPPSLPLSLSLSLSPSLSPSLSLSLSLSLSWTIIPLGADDLLPYLIYTILLLSPEHIHSNLR